MSATADMGGRTDEAGSGNGTTLRHHRAVLILGLPTALAQSFAVLGAIALMTFFKSEAPHDEAASILQDPALAGFEWLLVNDLGTSAVLLALFLGSLIVSGVGSVIQGYLRLRLEVFTQDPREIFLRTGWLRRIDRRIPRDKIQSVTLRRTLMHRLTGTAELVVDTSIQGESEAVLPTLSHRAAIQLRQELSRSAAPTQDGRLVDPSVARALLYGITGLRVGPLLLVGGFVMTQVGEVMQLYADSIVTGVEEAGWLITGLDQLNIDVGFAITAVAVLTILALAWLLSTVSALNMLARFELTLADGKFVKRYGLFEASSMTLPLERIQFLRLDGWLLRRALGYTTVHEAVAGEHHSLRRAEVPLMPLAGAEDTRRIVRLALGGLELNRLDWQPVSRKAIRRGLVRYAFALVILALAAVLAFGAPLLAVLLLAAVLAPLLAYWRWLSLGSAETEDVVAVKTGPFMKRIWIIPKKNIQGVDLTRTPFQRRAALASLTFRVAGSGHFSRPHLPDLPEAEAVYMQQRLVAHAARTAWWTGPPLQGGRSDMPG
ncbi:MAG: PH domain-containing protein, partial [Pseudomonadota bacterium]